MRFLLIEDDAGTASSICDALRDEGHNRVTASDGETGFARAGAGDFGALVVDRMRPDLAASRIPARACCPDRYPHLAERFTRIAQRRSPPGHGLGLSFAAAIAQTHGGTLHFADAAPGLAVTVRLPRASAPLSAPLPFTTRRN